MDITLKDGTVVKVSEVEYKKTKVAAKAVWRLCPDGTAIYTTTKAEDGTRSAAYLQVDKRHEQSQA